MTVPRRGLLLGALLVDLPVLAIAGVAGLRWGYADTLEAVLAWRLAHPWTCLPSIAAAALLIARRRPAAAIAETELRPEPPR